MRSADGMFWDNNDRYVSGEMSQGERIAWVVVMSVLGSLMMAALWLCSR